MNTQTKSLVENYIGREESRVLCGGEYQYCDY